MAVPRAVRLVYACPHGTLDDQPSRCPRHDAITLSVIDGPINGETFRDIVEQSVSPTMAAATRHHGPIGSTRRGRAHRARVRRAQLLYLPLIAPISIPRAGLRQVKAFWQGRRIASIDVC